MKLVGLSILHKLCAEHGDCIQQVTAWIAEVKEAAWTVPNDIKNRYKNASFLPDNRVVFNIKGNRYRLDTKVYYKHKTVVVMRAGTHSEYSEWRF